jgi:hypothetical protein
LVQQRLRAAGRQYADAKRAYEGAKAAALRGLPTDEEGRAKIVCRRHAERRAVGIDAAGRPACYDADHLDCQGCIEDVHENRIETW